MQSTTKLSPYRIFWATLIPEKHTVTKHDAQIIDQWRKNHHTRGCKEISIHGGSEEKLLNKIKSFAGLHKKYRVYIYTDKQFGLRRQEQPLTEILTKKQLADSFII